MGWKLTVDGTTKTTSVRQPDAVGVELTASERSTARFTFLQDFVPDRFDDVVIYASDGTTPLFGGVVLTRRQKPMLAGLVPTFTDVECAGYLVYADWCYVDVKYDVDVSLKTVLQDIVSLKLGAYGVTLDAAQALGPTLGKFEWKKFKVSDALRELADRTGYIVRMSATKVLRMLLPGDEAAPYSLTDADPNCLDAVYADKSDPVVNRVTVMCGPDGSWVTSQTWVANGTDTSWTTDIPAAPLVASVPGARAYLFLWTTAGGNAQNDETVTVGSKNYKFQDTLTNDDGNVHIGDDAQASLENLCNAINLGVGAGTAYAAVMTANTEVSAGMHSFEMMAVNALTVGEDGNSIAATTTCANLQWVGEGTVPHDTLQLGADAVPGSGGTVGTVTVGGLFCTIGTGAMYEWDNDTHTLSVGTASTPTAGTTIILTFNAQGPFPVVVTAAGSPVVEHVAAEESITDYAVGLELAQALLTQLGSSIRELDVTTLLGGWAPGQELTVALTGRVSGTFLVTSVSMQLVYDEQGGRRATEYWRYEVKAEETVSVNTSYLQQWRDLTSGGTGGSGGSFVSVNVGGGGGLGASALVPVYLGGSRYHPVQILPPVEYVETPDDGGAAAGGPVGVTETKVAVVAATRAPGTDAVALVEQAAVVVTFEAVSKEATAPSAVAGGEAAEAMPVLPATEEAALGVTEVSDDLVKTDK